ncbi:MAG TPA: HlyD family type I secretion periplasmic adaptor subunit, partial [Stellaceae bacterium]|nr:HlyD family type I secretion periplasmic adaptor subunit [Stellaceae bacterium]
RPWPARAEPSPLPLPHPDRDAADREFLPAVLEIIETPPSRFRSVLGYALCAVLAAMLLSLWLGRLSAFAVAPGEVAASGQTKVIEPREAGQVTAIPVRDGDHVAGGQILVTLDPTAAIADRTIVTNKLVNARAEGIRFTAEIAAAEAAQVNPKPAVVWPADIPSAIREREEGVLEADLTRFAAALSSLAAQRQEKESERDKFAGSIKAQKELIAIITQHVAMHEELARQGVESRALLLDARAKLDRAEFDLTGLEGSLNSATAAIAVLDSKIAKTRRDFAAAATQQLAAAESQAEQLAEALKKASKTVADMTLRAPIPGTIEAVAVTTVGQAVKPGQQLMQLVPDGQALEIKAYVLNSDIGFVRKGQKVTIKVDTFPYTRYGTIAGTVTQVGTDAIPGTAALRQQVNASQPVSKGKLSDTSAAEQTSDLVFPVTIAPSRTAIAVGGALRPLLPGMSVVAEITTGTQRALDYILFPLLRGGGAPAAR